MHNRNISDNIIGKAISFVKSFNTIQLRFKSDERIRLQLYLRTIWFCKANINKINTFFSRSNAITNYIGKKEDINKLVNIYKASEEV